jgi:hypothetical protein
MRTHTNTLVLAFALLIGPAVGRAYAVTIRDLVELSKEGVSDAVLIALIETDGSRFKMSPDDIRSVRSQGLSDAVIVAMLRTRPAAAPLRDGAAESLEPAPAPAPPPMPAVETAPSAPEAVIVQAPPVTVTQTVTQTVQVPHERRRVEVQQVPVYVPVYVGRPTRPVETKKEEPVYWGWGGKRRPDAWKEPVIIK